MTDDFDVSLGRRLKSLASAVPVAQPGDVSGVIRQTVRVRSPSRLALAGLLPVLALVVIGAVAAGVLKIGPGPGDSSAVSTDAANGPIESTTRSGDFELTIRSARARYSVGEPIEIEASLTYVGVAQELQIGHALGADDGPLGFGIDEPVIGDLRLTPGTQDACARTMLVPSERLSAAFAKSAGWSGDDPRSDAYLAFVRDPVLRLGAGTWHVYAIAAFSLGDCGPDPIEMRVDLAIEVAGARAPADGPVVATDSNGDFELTIRSPKGRYEAGEPIDVEATFTYSGDEPVRIVDNKGDGKPLAFGIEERVVGDLILGPAGHLPCISTMLEPGHTQISDFVKSGAWSGDDPFAEEIEAFFRDPELRLSEGTWHIWASADFFIGECGAERSELRVKIPIEVTPRAPTSSSDPPPEWAAIDILTAPEPATGCYQAYTEGRLVHHTVTGLGIGKRAGEGVVWPYGFTAREVVGVAVLVGPEGQVVAREGQVVGFSGPGASGEDGLIHACGEVRVVEADPTDNPAIDAVQAVDDDGTFRLELRSSKSTYAAGEAIDIAATLSYLGRGQTSFDGGVSFSGRQTDGSHSFASGSIVAMCAPRPIRDLPHERLLGDWQKVRSLPPGTWRVSASFSGSAPACTGDARILRASIDITVRPAGEPVESIALATSVDSSQHSSEDFCRGDVATGELALHPTTGLGLISSSGGLQPIRWPTGSSAEILPDGAILYGEGGQIVAREGDPMSFPGATAADGVFTVCGQFLFP